MQTLDVLVAPTFGFLNRAVRHSFSILTVLLFPAAFFAFSQLTARADVVATPIFSPMAGTYSSAQSVVISTTTSGASIRYTTDGSTPSSTTGAVYSTPVNIAATTTLKAIAYKSGSTDSAVAAGDYAMVSVVASDNFNRTDGEPGANWWLDPSTDATSVISGNQISSSAWGFAVSRWAVAGVFTDDQYSRISVVNTGGSTEVTVRGSDTISNQYYAFGVSVLGSWSLYKSAGGTDVTLAYANFTATGSDVIELRAVGSTLKGYINGILVATVVDSDLPTGVPGFNIYQDGAGDNWEGGNIMSDTTDTVPPSVPTGLGSSNVTRNSFTFGWTAATDNVGVTAYEVFRNGISQGTTTALTLAQANLTEGTTYAMTVRARDAAGNWSAVQVTPFSVTTSSLTASVVASDNFNRTDGAPGANWWLDPSTDATSVISGNQISSSAWGFAVSRWAVAGVFTDDQYSRISVVNTGGSTEVTVRGSGTISNQYYAFGVSVLGSWSLYKSAGGVDVTLAYANFTATGSDVIELRAVGSTLKGYINGILVATVVDSDLPTGVPGFNIYQDGAGDNWEGGNIVSSATDTTPPILSNGQPSGTQAAGTMQTTLSLTTDESATSRYSMTAGTAYAAMTGTFTTTGGTSHSTTVTGLVNGGSYTYYVRSIDAAGNATTSDYPITFSVARASLPYTTDFEASEGYILGSLNGQLGWTVGPGASVVSNADFSRGAQSVQLSPNNPPSVVGQTFASGSGQTVEFFDFYAKPVAGTPPGTASTFTIEQAEFAFQLSEGQGLLQTYNGNGSAGGTWTPTAFTIPLGAGNQAQNWVRLTARLDFTAQKWDLYANGQMVAANIPFISACTYLSSFQLQGDVTSASGLDDIFAGPTNPLFADADKDGMNDVWETANGLNPNSNDRDGDLDNDGISNIQEYLRGTDPSTPSGIPDSDGNGLPDAWETQYFGSIGVNPNADPDGDGFTNIQEFQTGRNPTKGALPDTTETVNLRVYSPSR